MKRLHSLFNCWLLSTTFIIHFTYKYVSELVHQFLWFSLLLPFLFPSLSRFSLIFIIQVSKGVRRAESISIQYLEHSREDVTSYVKATVVVLVADVLAFAVGQQVCGGRRPAVLVHLDRRLIRAERHQVPPVRAELAQETRRLLHVHHGEVGEDVLVELPRAVHVGARVRAAHRLPAPEPHHHVLRADPARVDRAGFRHGLDSALPRRHPSRDSRRATTLRERNVHRADRGEVRRYYVRRIVPAASYHSRQSRRRPGSGHAASRG